MQIGVGKSKVLFKKHPLPLQGYSVVGRRSDGTETDLYARAFVFRLGEKAVALVNLECHFISHHLKKAVVTRCSNRLPGISLGMENLLLCAQHTHSAPGGYAHYAFFNITSKGFYPAVFESYVKACSEALEKAVKDLEECKLYLNADLIAPASDVAFNRSLDAYNSNPDVVQQDDTATHLALDRMMKQLRISVSDTTDKGLINWFGVQACSIGSRNKKIHSDNKGYAASLFENDQSEERNFVAAFCQEAAADVSPNHYGRGKWWPRGRYEDDFKSAYYNGFIQFEKARQLIESEEFQIPVSDRLAYSLMYIDLSKVTCDPAYTHNGEPQQTGPAALGLTFLEGTPPDHNGIEALTAALIRLWAGYRNMLNRLPLIRSRKDRQEQQQLHIAHRPKKIVLELQTKKILGQFKLNRLPLPLAGMETADEIKRQYEAGAVKEHTWSPVVVPIQLFIIGEVAIVGFPGDLSTTAGMRLRTTLLEKLEPEGVLDVIITAYANEHSGYAVTWEEYQQPTFERGFTLFGSHTLAAFQTSFNRLAGKLIAPPARKHPDSRDNLQPPEFSAEELAKRTA